MGIPNEERCGPVARLVSIHMACCAILFKEQLQESGQETQELYLAFELGVIEYYHRTMLIDDEVEDPNQLFFEFLIFYSNAKYQNQADRTLSFWHKLAVDNLMHEERRLGFESISHQVNEDGTRNKSHAPPVYFAKALGLSS